MVEATTRPPPGAPAEIRSIDLRPTGAFGGGGVGLGWELRQAHAAGLSAIAGWLLGMLMGLMLILDAELLDRCELGTQQPQRVGTTERRC